MRRFLPLIACGLMGCVMEMHDRPPEPLAIGQQATDGTFEFLHDGDLMTVTTGANGLDMVSPCLLGAEMNPVAPLPHVTTTIDGVVVGALLR